jgi:DNA-binding CsgD family transcriptional regulator
LAEEYARGFDLRDLKTSLQVMTPSNVGAELDRLTTPLLVLACRDNLTRPPTVSMRVAARAPNARFALLDGANAFSLQEIAALDNFLASLPETLAPEHDLEDRLSSREVEVLRLIAAGKSNPQIAEELVISLNTVQRHVSNILAKTGAANRTEAALYARDRGIA